VTPDVVCAAYEDGFRPPEAPEEWDTLYTIVTGEACPVCGTAIGVLLGPPDMVDTAARNLRRDYGHRPVDGWAEGYRSPVYLFCDRPACRWNGVAEWGDLSSAIEEWVYRDAPTWRDRAGGDAHA